MEITPTVSEKILGKLAIRPTVNSKILKKAEPKIHPLISAVLV